VRKLVRNTYYLFSTASQAKRFVKEDWLAPGWRGFTRRLTAVEATFYVLQMVLGIVALWLVPGGRTKQLVVALLLFHWGVYVVANATNRFRVPLLPFFVLYVGPLLAGCAVRERTVRWRLAGAAACLAAFVAIVVTPYVRRAADADAVQEDPAGDATLHDGHRARSLAGAAATTQLIVGVTPRSPDLAVIDCSELPLPRAARQARAA